MWGGVNREIEKSFVGKIIMIIEKGKQYHISLAFSYPWQPKPLVEGDYLVTNISYEEVKNPTDLAMVPRPERSIFQVENSDRWFRERFYSLTPIGSLDLVPPTIDILKCIVEDPTLLCSVGGGSTIGSFKNAVKGSGCTPNEIYLFCVGEHSFDSSSITDKTRNLYKDLQEKKHTREDLIDPEDKKLYDTMIELLEMLTIKSLQEDLDLVSDGDVLCD